MPSQLVRARSNENTCNEMRIKGKNAEADMFHAMNIKTNQVETLDIKKFHPTQTWDLLNGGPEDFVKPLT